MLWQLIGPSPRPVPLPPVTPPAASALEVRMRCELMSRRLDRVLRRTNTPTTPCWFCGNPLVPDEVGLPCPACGDRRDGVRHRQQPRAARPRQARELAGRALADRRA
jgi:hypothetical protein